MIHPIIVPMRLVLASASPRRAELLRAAGFEFETLAIDLDERVYVGEAPEDYVRRLAMEKSARAMAEIVGFGFSRTRTNPPEGGSHANPPGGGSHVNPPEGGSHVNPPGGGSHANPPGGGSHVPESVVAQDFSPASASDQTVVLGADTAVVVDGAILGKPKDDDDAVSMLRRLSGRAHQVMTGVSLRGAVGEVSRVEVTTVEFAPLSEADLRWYVESGEGRDKAGAYAIQGLASRVIRSIHGSYSNVVGLPIAVVHELVAEIASRQRSGYPT